MITLIHFIVSLETLHLFDLRLSRNVRFAALSAVPDDVKCLALECRRSLSGSETRAGYWSLSFSLSSLHESHFAVSAQLTDFFFFFSC